MWTTISGQVRAMLADLENRAGAGRLPKTILLLSLDHNRRRGCSSAVERHVANVNVGGSNPLTRFADDVPRRPFFFFWAAAASRWLILRWG